MSFASSVQAMIASLKNNARRRKTLYDKKDVFNKVHFNKEIYNYEKKLSPEQREEIIRKAKAENRKEVIKNMLALIIALSIMAIVVLMIYKSLK